MASIAVAALAASPAPARAASPLLEFVSPASPFPVGFTASGGQVTATLAGFETVVHCSGSAGAGQITGPSSAVSSWVFSGCKAQGGSENGQKCKSPDATEEEIKAGPLVARLVYLNQALHQVGMLLNPENGIYMTFECGGEAVKARGPFLSPVGPVNQESSSFTATLSQANALQIPNEFENPNGEKLQAIPFGERGVNPPATTGVELSFAISTSAPLTIRSLTATEVEAKEREEAAAAAARKRQEEEAAAAAAAKKRQEDEAAARKRQEEATAAAAAAKQLQEEEARQARKRAQHRAKALRNCRKADSPQRRTRCEQRVKKRFRAQPAASASASR
jgi:hypothetical protein